MITRWGATLAVAMAIAVAAPAAAEFSTSVVKPTPIDPSGVIEGTFPGGKASYYFSADLAPGDLLTQISFDGRAGAQKSVDFALLDANARSAGSYWTQGQGAADESTRSFPIDVAGQQVVRVEVEGPATAKFRVELGGSAFPGGAASAPPGGQALSRSVRVPTPVGSSGSVAGKLPGPEKRAAYYVVVDVQKGDLLTQIAAKSRDGADKSLTLELLRDDASRGEWYWVHGSEPNEEGTRSFPIDRDGKQIIRLVVEGPETGSFQVDLGGTAIAETAPSDATAMAKP